MDDECITASPGDSGRKSRDFSSFLYARLVENLSIMLPAGCALYLFLAFAHLVLLPDRMAVIMASIALTTATICGSAIVLFHALVSSSRRSRLLSFGVAVAVLTNPLVHLQQTGSPRDTTMLAFVVLSLGLGYVDRVQIYTILAFGQLTWAAIALNAGWSDEWTHFAFSLLVAQVLAIVTFESRRRMYRTLFRQEVMLVARALTDPLTGLANRAALMGNLAGHFSRHERNPNHRFALCYIDLNGFKRINDVYGHSVGDEILQSVGRILKQHCRAADLAVRLGGDEFVVVHDMVDTHETAVAIAERTHAALAQQIRIEGLQLTAQSSVGVVWSGHGYANPDQLLEAADSAMYREKRLRGRAEVLETNDKSVAVPITSLLLDPARV